MSDQPDYDLVMPFVSVASKGGPHNDDAYVAGWEMGALDARLEHSNPLFHEQPIRTDSAQQADLIGMKHGYRVEITEQGDGWSWIKLVRQPAAREDAR